MKILFLVCTVVVAVAADWEPSPPKKYHGPLHYPVIHKGVPTETPEVQHAKAAHSQAVGEAASHGHHQAVDHHENHEPIHKYHGPLHYPVIHKGVPVDTPEVQHAKEAHLEAVSSANHGSGEGSHHHDHHEHHEPEQKYHGPLHYPVIHKGVPVDTPAVQHARDAHLSAVAGASHHGSSHY